MEGSSAAGSAKQGRDRRTQAVLALRGKILNVERLSSESKIYQNTELKALMSALGLVANRSNSVELTTPSKLRYNKIILMTDADVDGAHIRLLLLTFFYRYQISLLTNGHVYIACPPLFRVETGKIKRASTQSPLRASATAAGEEDEKGRNDRIYACDLQRTSGREERTTKHVSDNSHYAWNKNQVRILLSNLSKATGKQRKSISGNEIPSQREDAIASPGGEGLGDVIGRRGNAIVQRFKGLGEMMADQLWETTMNPMTRRLKQVCIADADKASRLLETLMGSKAESRRDFIAANWSTLHLAELDY